VCVRMCLCFCVCVLCWCVVCCVLCDVCCVLCVVCCVVCVACVVCIVCVVLSWVCVVSCVCCVLLCVVCGVCVVCVVCVLCVVCVVCVCRREWVSLELGRNRKLHQASRCFSPGRGGTSRTSAPTSWHGGMMLEPSYCSPPFPRLRKTCAGLEKPARTGNGNQPGWSTEVNGM